MTPPTAEAVGLQPCPCPFCGGAPEHRRFKGDGFMLPRVEYTQVRCLVCSIGTEPLQPYGSPEDRALAAWNRRALSAVPVGDQGASLRDTHRAPDGWVLVPKEPTIEMRLAGTKVWRGDEIGSPVTAIWAAMVAASPEAAGAPVGQRQTGPRMLSESDWGRLNNLVYANGTDQDVAAWVRLHAGIRDGAREALQQDSARLDWLDQVNARTNERNGTTYGWRFDINHNRAALTDHNHPPLSVRAAIDKSRTANAVGIGAADEQNTPANSEGEKS